MVASAKAAISEGSHSFAAASRLFDRRTRERCWLFYAWCRRCDDIVDAQHAGHPLAENDHIDAELLKNAEDRLQAIRVLTRRAFERQPTADPAFDGLGLLAEECGLTPDMAEDIIAGFALDVAEWRPRTEGDLMRYCYHVAGAVGIAMAKIMGVPGDDGDTLDRACDLGLAFQLANIARDVIEDDANGRCYIPTDWLVELDLPPGGLAWPQNREKLATLMPRMIALMERYAAASRLGAARLAFRQRWAVLAAARIYTDIGHKVLAAAAQAWDRRIVVTRREKLVHVARALREALRNKPEAPAEPIDWTRHDFRPVAGW
nr:phytoene/squalene synthase family protein [Qipengyuania algicida]